MNFWRQSELSLSGCNERCCAGFGGGLVKRSLGERKHSSRRHSNKCLGLTLKNLNFKLVKAMKCTIDFVSVLQFERNLSFLRRPHNRGDGRGATMPKLSSGHGTHERGEHIPSLVHPCVQTFSHSCVLSCSSSSSQTSPSALLPHMSQPRHHPLLAASICSCESSCSSSIFALSCSRFWYGSSSSLSILLLCPHVICPCA